MYKNLNFGHRKENEKVKAKFSCLKVSIFKNHVFVIICVVPTDNVQLHHPATKPLKTREKKSLGIFIKNPR